MTDRKLTRREALARLGLAPVAAYVVPAVLALSSPAAASGNSPPSEPSGASDPSDPSDPSVPTPPTPPSPPSNPSGPEGGDDESDESSSDRCHDNDRSGSGAGGPSISIDDMQRAQASVDAGYAKPLNQIWQGIISNYPGRIVSVRFTGFQYRPRYRLKAVSPSGRLETIIVSARTGAIIRIVGC